MAAACQPVGDSEDYGGERPRPEEKDMDMDRETQTIVFTNHPPLRIKGTPHAMHFIHPGIGGAYLSAYRNQREEWLVWETWVPCTDSPCTHKFVGKFRPGNGDVMETQGFRQLFAPTNAYGYEPYSQGQKGKIRLWLEGLGLSKVEEFD